MEMKSIIKLQRGEMTDYLVYKRLAGIVRNDDHKRTLERIAGDESKHYEMLKKLTGIEPGPYRFKLTFFVFVSRFLGLNFGLKLMESAENLAPGAYEQLKADSPDAAEIIRDEEGHEKTVISMLDEESLKYVSSVVLGLNDALVEFTAALAGFTLALQNGRLIGVVGLVTGIAASLSMAASEYLSTKQEETDKDPVKASVYTGIAYIITVSLLVSPYFYLKNVFWSLALVVGTALFVIFVFTFYISVAKQLDFKKRFIEMAGLSLTVAGVTFFIGFALRKFFGVE
jgi:vacuolar iron transporter family protein